MICGLLASQLELDDITAQALRSAYTISARQSTASPRVPTRTDRCRLPISRYKERRDRGQRHSRRTTAMYRCSARTRCWCRRPTLSPELSVRAPAANRWKPISSASTQLEEVADSFKGVSKAYAIQAGREIQRDCRARPRSTTWRLRCWQAISLREDRKRYAVSRSDQGNRNSGDARVQSSLSRCLQNSEFRRHCAGYT